MGHMIGWMKDDDFVSGEGQVVATDGIYDSANFDSTTKREHPASRAACDQPGQPDRVSEGILPVWRGQEYAKKLAAVEGE